jgi:adenylate kinase
LKKIDTVFNENGFKLPIGINLEISKKTAIQRISTRRICPKCLRIFDPTANGFSENRCPKCKIELVSRDDDQENAVVKRLGIFEKETLPVILKLKNGNRIIEINGEQKIPDVRKEIRRKVFNER